MSNFKLISRPLGTVQCFVLQRDDGAEFEILSGYGAGLNAWRIPDNNGKLQDLLFGYREGDDIFKMGPDTNAGCRLAPFPGRVAYAKFNWNGNDYQLVNNVSWAPHALHGFLQNKEWNLLSFESDSEKCVATFSIDWPGAFTGFPFPFRAVNKVEMWLEVFIVPGVNDSPASLDRFVQCLREISPDQVQVNSLDRPGTEDWIEIPSRERLEEIKAVFEACGCPVTIISRKQPTPAVQPRGAN